METSKRDILIQVAQEDIGNLLKQSIPEQRVRFMFYEGLSMAVVAAAFVLWDRFGVGTSWSAFFFVPGVAFWFSNLILAICGMTGSKWQPSPVDRYQKWDNLTADDETEALKRDLLKQYDNMRSQIEAVIQRRASLLRIMNVSSVTGIILIAFGVSVHSMTA